MSAGSFIVKVKDGDYGYNEKTGKYGTKDYLLKTDNLAEALRSWLEYVESFVDDNDDDESIKATITFRHEGH